MGHYKCIIFDCDGVLVDSENIGNQVLVELANEYGAGIDIAYAIKKYTGTHLYSCIQDIETLCGKPIPMSFEAEFRKRSFLAFAKYLTPISGIENVLKSLRIPFCVASSGPKNKIESNLRNTGLLKYFKGNIFSCYDINKWKPAPEIFLHAAKTMDFSVEECLVIEDSSAGVAAAISGGFDVFAYAENGKAGYLPKQPTKVFHHMNELLALIDSE